MLMVEGGFSSWPLWWNMRTQGILPRCWALVEPHLCAVPLLQPGRFLLELGDLGHLRMGCVLH